MSNPRDKYGINRAAEARGAPVAIDEWEFLLRSTTGVNREYRFALGQKFNAHRAELVAMGETPAAFALHDDLVIEAFSEHVMVGWRGVTNGDGKSVEFTPEKCAALLRDCPDIWEQLKEAATDPKRFPPAQEDGEQLGKS
jgi:hypothetical protein